MHCILMLMESVTNVYLIINSSYYHILSMSKRLYRFVNNITPVFEQMYILFKTHIIKLRFRKYTDDLS